MWRDIMSINFTYSRIAEVVKWAYVYNSIDLHHIPEELKTTLHCILQHKLNRYAKVVESGKKTLSPTMNLIAEARQEILDLIPEIDRALHSNELLCSTYYLSDDAKVIYVYVPEDIELTSSIYTNLLYMGTHTVIHIIPKNLMNYPKKMHKVLYTLISSMVNIYEHGKIDMTFKTPNDYIKAYSEAVILLSLVDLDNNEKMKETIFDFLAKHISLSIVEDSKEALEKIKAVYKETQCYSVEELLDRAYLLAIV